MIEKSPKNEVTKDTFDLLLDNGGNGGTGTCLTEV
jgi:hypothetical protein